MWSAAELEAILDALPARVTWWSSDLRLRFANESALGILGQRPRPDLLGALLTDHLPPEAADEVVQHVREALGGVPQHFDRVQVIEGEEHHFEAHLMPTRENGSVTGLVLFGVDSTARMRALEAVRRNTAVAALLTERQRIAADLAVLVRDRLLQPRAQLGAEGTTQLLDDVIASLRTTIGSLRERPEPPTAEAPDLSTQPVALRPGLRDVAAPASGLSVDELLTVLDALPAAVTAWDPGYYNTFANAASVSTYAFGSREAVHGRQGAELLGQEAYEASLQYGEAAMAGHAQQFVRTMVTRDGTRRSAQVDYVAQRVGGEPVGAVALVVDVTARVEAEEKERQSVERLTVLEDRARIAEDLHDLVIQRVFAAGLLLRATYGDRQANLVSAAECIDDALAELSQSTHALHGDVADFDFPAALERLVRHAGCSPVVRTCGPLDAMPADLAVDVLAVLSESLSNAAQHAHASRVDVLVEVGQDTVVLRVTDDGKDLPESPSRHSGLANLAARAARHGGSFEVGPGPSGGTVLDWSARLPQSG